MKRSLWLLSVLLATAIAVSGTYWVLQVVPSSPPPPGLVAVPAGDWSADTRTVDVAPIANLFRTPGKAISAANINVAGVIATGGKDRGVALLSVDKKVPRAFEVGETVYGDAVLKHVNADGVVLEQEGFVHEVLIPVRAAAAGIKPAN